MVQSDVRISSVGLSAALSLAQFCCATLCIVASNGVSAVVRSIDISLTYGVYRI